MVLAQYRGAGSDSSSREALGFSAESGLGGEPGVVVDVDGAPLTPTHLEKPGARLGGGLVVGASRAA